MNWRLMPPPKSCLVLGFCCALGQEFQLDDRCEPDQHAMRMMKDLWQLEHKPDSSKLG